ncbi:MAG: flavin reductase family protein [Saprospiraceae bacterium]|nr:flavin reductase family protein [Saprospiraceae bacterium]
MYVTIQTEGQSPRDFYQYLIGCVGPRPIAFVSTLDKEGSSNLAPYSFFNAFSSNPPIVVFSSSLRVKDATEKDTLHNIRHQGEAVINMVNYAIVHQMAIAGIEYPSGIDEFKKSGLTPLASQWVKPFRVAESPASLECRLEQIVSLGEGGGAGHLIVCRVVAIHIRADIIDEHHRIDPHKMDLMGRLGRSYYVRASGAAVHTIVQPITHPAIGFDAIPEEYRHSAVLTGQDLATLAGLEVLPDFTAISESEGQDETWNTLTRGEASEERHRYLQHLIRTGNVGRAWRLILTNPQKDRISS